MVWPRTTEKANRLPSSECNEGNEKRSVWQFSRFEPVFQDLSLSSSLSFSLFYSVSLWLSRLPLNGRRAPTSERDMSFTSIKWPSKHETNADRSSKRAPRAQFQANRHEKRISSYQCNSMLCTMHVSTIAVTFRNVLPESIRTLLRFEYIYRMCTGVHITLGCGYFHWCDIRYLLLTDFFVLPGSRWFGRWTFRDSLCSI